MLCPRTATVINYLITHSDVYYGNCMIVPVGRAGCTNVVAAAQTLPFAFFTEISNCGY